MQIFFLLEVILLTVSISWTTYFFLTRATGSIYKYWNVKAYCQSATEHMNSAQSIGESTCNLFQAITM